MNISESPNFFNSNPDENNSLRLENQLDFLKSNLELNNREEKYENLPENEDIQALFQNIFYEHNSNNNNQENPNENTKPTDTNQTLPNISKEKEKIFDIKKLSKTKGRRKQGQTELYQTEAIHNKFKEDNIVNKIKIYFINSTMKLINKKYAEFLNDKSNKRLLQKIKPNFTKVYNKKKNRQFLSKKISEIFSEELSGRCSTFQNKKNHNKEQIENLMKKNKAKEVINLLNKTLEEMYEIYISENDNIKIPEYHLENDLIQIEIKNGKEYAQEYKKKAMNLVQIISVNKKRRI
jgi:hypothetical protein